MTTEIGNVKGLIGTVTATAADGSQRTLQVGDKLFANEIVSTGAAGAVEIEFADGSIMDLGRSSQTMLDNEVFDPQQTAQAQTAVPDDVEALQQALVDGADPTQVGEATAAGAGTQDGNEGHQPVTVDFLAPEVAVVSGFDTTGPSLGLPEIVNEDVFDDVPVAIDDGVAGQAGILDESNTVFEDQADFNSPEGTSLGFINSRGEFVPQQTTAGNILANDSFGANGLGGIVSVTYTGTSAGVTGTLVGGVATLQMADPGAIESNPGPIWTLTVEPNGDYSFTLNKPYVHSAEGEDIAQELFQYTIQDADDDTASATLTFNIVDDVPHINNERQQSETPSVYESNIGDSNAQNSVSLPINFGADGPANIGAVSLSTAGIVDQNSAPLTSNDVELTYTWDAVTSTLTGMAGDIPVLTMTVVQNVNSLFTESYGVDVRLLDNIDHPISGIDNLIINIGYTATDFDGDAVDGTFAVNMVDDVPIVTTNPIETQSFELLLTNLDLSASAGNNNSFGYYVMDDQGQPTVGEVVWDGVHNDSSAAVTVTGHAPSEIGFFIIPNGNVNGGLANGSAVTFVEINGEWQATLDGITPLASAAGHVLFDNTALNYDTDAGAYVYQIDNARTGNLNWEDIAGGGDRDNNDVNVNADWTQTSPLAVDESDLSRDASFDFSSAFNFNFGADEQEARDAIVYELSKVDGSTGLVDTLTDKKVTLHVVNGVVEGHVIEDSAEVIVFTLSVDPTTGVVALDQQRAVVHSDVNNPDDATGIASGLISLSATITDDDGDTATNSIDVGSYISFEDDAPMGFDDQAYIAEDTISVAGNVLTNDLAGADTATVSSIGVQNGTYGNVEFFRDGSYTYSLNNAASNVQALAVGQKVTDSFEYSLTDKDGDSDKAILNIQVTGTNDLPITLAATGLGDEDSSGIPVSLSGTDIDGTIASFTIGSLPEHGALYDSDTLLTVGATVTASINGAELTFVPDSNWSGDTSFDYTAVDNSGGTAATSATASIVVNPVADAPTLIMSIAIDNVQMTHVPSYQYDLSVFAALTDVDGSETLSGITINGLPDNASITSTANIDGTYAPGTLTLVSDHELTADEINAIHGSVTSTDEKNGVSDTHTTDSNVKAADYVEGFQITSDALWFSVASNETTDVLLEGTTGNDLLFAGAGDDILIGGTGNDLLFGGEGSDIFVWNHDDIGTVVTPAHDIVRNFDVDNDQLNLADLLSDPSVPHTIEGIATEADNHLQINIKDATGTVQEIELNGVDATAFGTDANATLQSLLDTGVINDGI
jgi:VCBS repeat-containing protein